MTLARAVATLGGIGLIRPAPGTWASAMVLPAAWLGPAACLGLSVLLLLAGLWAVASLAREGAAHDPGWIVIDEGAGQLLALSLVPAGAPWLWVVAGFALFRFFDILKLGPVGWADRRKGTAWVMLDDLLAGAMAAAALLLLRLLWPGGTL
ncbi:phosphatidylglycerophosphatase A [Siccirubricoccus sp. G192]|uniref:phosphatidylglycerophosphatase A family protein n=1 Tax=Siccirubricoccus sp. G192 TaxID=2849651 RepID=UPI001C2C2161|nr:phosphatidylglycerophosphatase A [Siccirubricoccus sp. G192]MBV1798228.1 phosphatidylglycerophosphatase A [Siccirubricoccus sp. G192]